MLKAGDTLTTIRAWTHKGKDESWIECGEILVVLSNESDNRNVVLELLHPVYGYTTWSRSWSHWQGYLQIVDKCLE